MERTYIINVRKNLTSTPPYQRTNRAVKAVFTFLKRHFKAEQVRIGPKLNQLLWKNGNKNPPTRIKVVGIKDDKDPKVPVIVELFGFKYPEKKEVKKDEKKEAAAKEVADELKGEEKKEAKKAAEEKKKETATEKPANKEK